MIMSKCNICLKEAVNLIFLKQSMATDDIKEVCSKCHKAVEVVYTQIYNTAMDTIKERLRRMRDDLSNSRT
uniref:Uncharacterized protein n=1 Tax=viral metagenome TaxID=1070528 RepID=A0A6M3JCK4_9ZZZZ